MNHLTGMKTKWILVAVFFATGFSCSFSAIAQNDEYKNLPAQELTAIIDGRSDMEKRQFAENEKMRQAMINLVKQAYSMAQAAQAEGLDKTEKFKKRLEQQTDQLLAEHEARKSSENENQKPSEVTEAEMTTYGTAHAAEFDALIKAIWEGEKEQLSKEQLDVTKKNWATIKIRADRARKAGIEKDPDVQLQMKWQLAQLLASAYQQWLQDTVKLTPEELKEYYQSNPDADPVKIKQQAEAILLRIQTGESFSALAKEYSGDATAATGGLLRWFGRNIMVKEFEDISFSLQKGQISNLVKTKFGYHIIRTEDRQFRKPIKSLDDVASDEVQELVLVRHILISTNAVTEAEAKIKYRKIKFLVEDATLKYPVEAPADFTVNAPPANPSDLPVLRLPSPTSETQKKTLPQSKRRITKKR